MARTHRGRRRCTIATAPLRSGAPKQIKNEPGGVTRGICGRSKRRKMFVIVTANSKNITKANPLHYLQVPAGAGLIVSSSSPIIQNESGRIELVSRSRSRNLSISDHSCTDSRRKTTTTPAHPASATAFCGAVLRASLGSISTFDFSLPNF